MRKMLGAIALALLAVGCGREAPSPKPEPVVEAPVSKPPALLFAHRVSFRGQTLSTIAKWYTGDAANWRQMTDPVNTGLTECCAKLKVNRVVYIPRELVTQTKPMPAPKVVTRPAKPLAKEPSAPKAEPTTAEPDAAEAKKAEETKDAELPDTAPVEKPSGVKPAPPPEEDDEEILGPR